MRKQLKHKRKNKTLFKQLLTVLAYVMCILLLLMSGYALALVTVYAFQIRQLIIAL